MRSAKIFVNGCEAGILAELDFSKKYRFNYFKGYSGALVSLTLPLNQLVYEFDSFPPFPEGYQLDGLLKFGKIDRNDLFSQLLAVGADLVGNVTVKEIKA
jgi:serine/threonine-protein kinase HipA